VPVKKQLHVFRLQALPSRKTSSQKHELIFLQPPSNRIAFTTDSDVVKPLFFPGGDIGSLAVKPLQSLSKARAILVPYRQRRGCANETTDNIHQGRFSRTRSTHNRDIFARLDRLSRATVKCL
jgi:hypothetical protein